MKNFMVLSNIAFRNIFRNFRRSLFSIVAIGVAVFFIVIAISYINGMIGSMTKVIQTYETGQISVFTKEYEENKNYLPLQYPLEYNDGGIDKAVKEIENISGVKKVFLRIMTSASLTNSLVKHALLWGIDYENERKINNFNITNNGDGLIIGKHFTKNENGKYNNECIIGIGLARKLQIVKEILEIEEFNDMISKLDGDKKTFFESCYKLNNNLYYLSIGNIIQTKIAKKGDFKEINKNKKIMIENEKVYALQNKLLDIYINYFNPVVQLKIISSQYSEKFINPKIVGIFDFDFEQYNTNMIIMPFEKVQKLATLTDKTQNLIVYTEKNINPTQIAQKIRAIFNNDENIVVKEWFKESRVSLFNQMKAVYTFIYAFFIIIASFLIINTIVMIINERIKEIGMMGSLGMTKLEIVLLFFLEAFFLSLLGSFFGAIFSGFITFALSFYPIKFLSLTGGGMDMPISNTIFIDFSIFYLIQGFFIGVIVSGCCTIIPSFRSVKVEPVEALRR